MISSRDRLHRPMLRPCRWARQAYSRALGEGVWVGSLPRRQQLRLDALALLGWPRSSLRYHGEQFRRWTAHPGDVWLDTERRLAGVVWKVDSRGTWLLVRSDEALQRGLGPEVLLVPPYRYLVWTSARRGWLT